MAQAASYPTFRRAQGRLFRKVRERWGTPSCGAIGGNYGWARPAAKAIVENKRVIAALKRCATQNQAQAAS